MQERVGKSQPSRKSQPPLQSKILTFQSEI
jgi:hypothetical protein